MKEEIPEWSQGERSAVKTEISDIKVKTSDIKRGDYSQDKASEIKVAKDYNEDGN